MAPYESPEERKRRMLEAMAASMQPLQQQPQQQQRTAPLPPPSPLSTIGAPAPAIPSEPVSTSAPTPRIGYSTAGLTGVDKLMEQRKAYEDADSESKVKVSGDFAEIEPPTAKNKRSRWKSLGTGVLTGLAMSDPENPLQGLGMAIGGGVTGAVSPRSGAKLSRRFETMQLDNDITRGLKLEQEQAQLGGMEALRRQRELEPQLQAEKMQHETEINNAKLEIEWQKAARLITKQEADRQQRELDRASREKIAADRITSSEKIAALPQRGDTERTERRDEERRSQYESAQTEFDQLTADEVAAGEEKNRAYAYLEQLKKDAKDKGLEYDPTMTADIREAKTAAETANNFYRTFGPKKATAKSKMQRHAESPSTTKYSGRTMSQANLERYAKDKGLTVEEARKKIEGQGVRVQ